jgi:hypothetical protein
MVGVPGWVFTLNTGVRRAVALTTAYWLHERIVKHPMSLGVKQSRLGRNLLAAERRMA